MDEGVAMKIVCFVLAVLLLAAPAGAQQVEGGVPDGEAVAEFEKRVTAYVALRDQLSDGPSDLDETANPGEIAAAERTLAARIQTARAAAKQGDIFTPAIQARFLSFLNPEMKGTRGRNTRGIIWDEGPGPGAVPLKVNGGYPRNQPLGSVPPNILETLPPLPEGIEYRFVHRHLVLRDARANLIIDYMRAAIPGA
jgi:hypothetical protein